MADNDLNALAKYGPALFVDAYCLWKDDTLKLHGEHRGLDGDVARTFLLFCLAARPARVLPPRWDWKAV